MNLTFGEGVLYSILGMLVVFFGLICLQFVIYLLGKFVGNGKSAAAAPAVQAAAASAASAPVSGAAPGSAGDVMLYDTPDRDAAMIMAITANKLGKPLNELRFKSIREVK